MTADRNDLSNTKSAVRGGPIRGLVLCGVALIVAIAIGTATMVGNFRERALNSSERELENTVLLLARHFDQQLEDFEVVQKDLITHMQLAGIVTGADYRRAMFGHDVHMMLKAKISAMSYVGGVNLFDADGRLINSSEAWPPPAVNVADRAYFKTFKSDPQSPVVVVEAVHSRITGVWTTVLARKLIGPDGEFLGAIGRGIEPSHFEKFFASVALGDDASISMFHRDGTLLARYPHIDEMTGRNFVWGPLFQQVLSKAGHATTRIESPVDGQDRLASARELTNFPIVMTATTTVSAALADWREQIRFLIGVAALSAFVIVIMLFLIVRQLSRQHQATQRHLRLEKQRLDTAINNMTQGLLLFDSAHRVVVCNQRYIEMYGLSPSVIKPGCAFRDVIAHRKQTGSFNGDVEQYCSNILRDMPLGKVAITMTTDGRSIQIANQPLADGGWVATHEDITERRRSDEQIAHLAHYDALTDLPNRTLFRDRLEQEIKRIQRGGQLAVLYIDIDEFKSVNDSLGHPIGDELLKAVADRLRGCVRETDIVARLGGDEFAIVQTAVGHTTDVTDLVARIYQAIRQPCECLGHQLAADASIGIALSPQDGTDLDQLLKNADLAMYGAKADGRRTYRFFEPDMDARVKARRTLELDLRQAIVEGGFELYYQPLVNLRNNRVTGCEALLRWHHPERGMISPAEFIPVAEETGLINQLGEWVLTAACAEAATWPHHVKLAVNVSPVQFKSQTLAMKVAGALAASGLSADRLELEITEAVLIRDDDAALAILHQLRAIGVRIALDDFGTGYSSLSYLQRFPFDKIKIDRCFITDIAKPGGSSSIVQAVVNIAAARNMTTTAEGVETPQQRDMLRTLGCTEMQGYLFSPAKPATEVRQLLRSRHRRAAAVA
jgi:diguanylate cyclase (GGDEF)-like protein